MAIGPTIQYYCVKGLKRQGRNDPWSRWDVQGVQQHIFYQKILMNNIGLVTQAFCPELSSRSYYPGGPFWRLGPPFSWPPLSGSLAPEEPWLRPLQHARGHGSAPLRWGTLPPARAWCTR